MTKPTTHLQINSRRIAWRLFRASIRGLLLRRAEVKLKGVEVRHGTDLPRSGNL